MTPLTLFSPSSPSSVSSLASSPSHGTSRHGTPELAYTCSGQDWLPSLSSSTPSSGTVPCETLLPFGVTSVRRFPFLCKHIDNGFVAGVHIIVGYSVAVPAASLTITRRLYKITRFRSMAVTKAEVKAHVRSEVRNS